ncbi:hypothetical protein [Halomarina oriensis]|uniref:Uncharacterized protein n=1 Tax=Halomarina oriensis TaxID=671145 RepID=A0A6B0GQJ8_9EURY|nr:hypothetical protein [Halomarina oriensis]MWG34943.1 hypothetical protein [Halomarina oriensis]
MNTDRPTYDGAAYAVDQARRHADEAGWETVGDHAVDALEQVGDAPYPHLVDRLHRQATDVVLSCKRDAVDADRVVSRLDGMQETLGKMHALALDGATMFPDEFDGVTDS